MPNARSDSTPAAPIPGTELDVINGGMRTIYKRCVAYAESRFPGDQPDLVVVYIGGNDFSGSDFGPLEDLDQALTPRAEGDQAETEGSGKISGLEAIEAYSEALQEVLQAARTRRPEAPILMLAPNATTMSAESTPEEQAYTAGLVQRGVRHAYETFREWCKKNKRDANVSFHILEPSPAIANPKEDPSEWGLLRHWSVKGHTKVARALVGVIEEAVPGWKATSVPTPCPVMDPVTTEVGDTSALACNLM